MKETSATTFLSAGIRATEWSSSPSRVLSQPFSQPFFSGLRPGSSNLLCHTGRFSYRPCHDTAATHPRETHTPRTKAHNSPHPANCYIKKTCRIQREKAMLQQHGSFYSVVNPITTRSLQREIKLMDLCPDAVDFFSNTYFPIALCR